MIDYFKTNGRGRFLFTLLLPIGLIALIFYTLSPEAVSHPIHAAKIGTGQFLHGWNLSCSKLPDSSSHQCETQIQGKRLEIKTTPQIPDFMSGPLSCEAWFDSQTIICEDGYITSSYWERGIELSGSPELAEAFAQEPPMRNWQSIFYGWYEFEYIQFGAILTILYALFAFTFSFKRFSSQPTLPVWLQVFVIGAGAAILIFFIVPKVVPHLIAEFSMNNINRGGKTGRFDWAIRGLPALILSAILVTSWRFGWQERVSKSRFVLTITHSLSLTFILFFISYLVVFVQLILLDYID